MTLFNKIAKKKSARLNALKSSPKGRLIVSAALAATMLTGGIAMAASAPTAAETSKTQYIVFPSYTTTSGRTTDYTYYAQYVGQTKTFDNHTYVAQQLTVNGETKLFWVREGYDAEVLTGARSEGVKKGADSIIKVSRNSKYDETTSDSGTLITYYGTTNTNKNKNLYDDTLHDSSSAGFYGGAVNSPTTAVGLNETFVVGGTTVNGTNRTVAVTYDPDTGNYKTKSGTVVDVSHVYVLGGETRAFTNTDGSIYTSPVYGYNNEILRTATDNGKIYSYWGAEIDPSNVSLTKLTAQDYLNDINRLNNDINANYKNLPRDFQATAGKDGGTISLATNYGENVPGDITVQGNGGTEGDDTYVTVGVGEHTYYDPTTGKYVTVEASTFDVPTGSKVEVTSGGTGAAKETTTIKVNGNTYTITDTDTDTDTTYTFTPGTNVTSIDATNNKNTENTVTVNVDNLGYSVNSTKSSSTVELKNGLNFQQGDYVTIEDGTNGTIKISGNESKIKEAAQSAIDIQEGNENVTVSSETANDVKTYKISAENTTLVNGDADKTEIDNGYTYKVKDTKGNTVTLNDVASASKLGNTITQVNTNTTSIANNTTKINNNTNNITTNTNNITTLQGQVIKGGAIDNETGKISLQPVKGDAIELTGTLADYVVDDVTQDTTTGDITITRKDRYSNGTLKDITLTGIATRDWVDANDDDTTYTVKSTTSTDGIIDITVTSSEDGSTPTTISNIASKTYVDNTEDYVTDGKLDGSTGTITLTRKLGDTVKIDGLETYVKGLDTNTYVTSAEYDKTTKKITITQNAAEDSGYAKYELDLSDITSGLSSTDYSLVKGTYKVQKDGTVKLTVKDRNGTTTEESTIEGIAVVYDGKTNAKYGTNGPGNLISTNSKGAGDSLGGSIVLGDDAYSQGKYSTVVGTNSELTRNETARYEAFGQSVNVQGTSSTVVGSNNNIESTANGGIYANVANSVMGANNNVTDSNGVVIQGTGNEVTNAYKDMNIDPWTDGLKIVAGDYSTLSEKDSGAVAVIGGANKISDTTSATVIGFGNTVSKTKDANSNDVFVAGSDNTLTDVTNSVVLGNEVTMSGLDNVISVGNGNSVAASNSVAIGFGASVKKDGEGEDAYSTEGAVALGWGSVANRAAGEYTGEKGYLATDADNDATWISKSGAVSVGSEYVTRQITNVAAGSEDTDAVNVAQLKRAKTKVAKGTNIASVVETEGEYGQSIYTVNADGTTVSNGDDNVIVTPGTKDENNVTDYSVKLANILNIGESNPVTINGDKGTVNGLTNKTFDANNIVSGQAATEDQLKQVKSDIETASYKGWTVSTNKNTEGGTQVKEDVDSKDVVDFSNSDGNINIEQEGTDIKLKLDDDVAINNSLTVGDNNTFVADAEKGSVLVNGKLNVTGATHIEDGDSSFAVNNGKVYAQAGTDYVAMTGDGVKVNGITVGTKDAEGNSQIHGVAAGTEQTDAVNVSQLEKAAAKSKTEVKTTEEEKNLKVDPSTDETDGHTIYTVTMNRDLDVDSVTAGDNVFNKTGLTIGKEGTSQIIINQTNISMGGQQIHNVAKGEAGTDAVNVSQLKEEAAAANTDTHVKAGEYSVTNNTVTLDMVDKNGTVLDDKVTISDVASATDVGDINNFNDTVKNEDGSTTTVVDAINNIDNRVTTVEVDVKNIKTDITNLDNRVTEVSKQHTTVTNKDGNISITETKNDNGGTNYELGLKDSINVTNITTENITTNNIDAKKIESTNMYVTNVDETNDNSVINKNYFETNSKNITPGSYAVENNQVTMTYTDGAGNLTGDTAVITNVASKTELDQTNQQVNYNTQNINNLYGSVNNLYGDVDKLSGRINRVGAGAAALAALHPLDFDPDDKWDFAVGYGNYRGANAAAVGAYYRPNEDTMFSVGGSMGGGENMVNVGFSVKLGRGTNNVTTSKVAMAKELKDLRSTVVTQAAQIAALTAMVNQLIENTDAQPIESQYIAPGTERYEIVNVERDPEVEGLLPIERVRAIETEEAQAASENDVAE